MPRITFDTSPSTVHFNENGGPVANGLLEGVNALWRGRVEGERLAQERGDRLWSRDIRERELARQQAQDEQARGHMGFEQGRETARDEQTKSFQNEEQAIRALQAEDQHDRWQAADKRATALDSRYAGEDAERKRQNDLREKRENDQLNDPQTRSLKAYEGATKAAREQLGPTADPVEVKRAADAIYDRLQVEPNSRMIPRERAPAAGAPAPAAPAMAPEPAPAAPPVAGGGGGLWSAMSMRRSGAPGVHTIGDVTGGRWFGHGDMPAASAPAPVTNTFRPQPGGPAAAAPVAAPAGGAAAPLGARHATFVQAMGRDIPDDEGLLNGMLSDDPATVEQSLTSAYRGRPDQMAKAATVLKQLHGAN